MQGGREVQFFLDERAVACQGWDWESAGGYCGFLENGKEDGKMVFENVRDQGISNKGFI